MTIRRDLAKMIDKRDGCTGDEIARSVIVYLCRIDVLDPAKGWLDDDPVMQVALDEMYPDALEDVSSVEREVLANAR